jgi:hypothetical protein
MMREAEQRNQAYRFEIRNRPGRGGRVLRDRGYAENNPHESKNR